MKRAAIALALNAVVAVSAAAHAQGASIVLDASDSGRVVDHRLMPVIANHASLAFSDQWVAAMKSGYQSVAAQSPASVSVNDAAPFIVANMPVAQMTATTDETGSKLDVIKATFDGGLTITAASVRPPGKRSGGTTGGTLTLTNITVDMAEKAIYADLKGGNGVGLKESQKLWNYASIEGPISSQLGPCQAVVPPACSRPADITDIKISGLTITQSAFDLFAHSLGMTIHIGIPGMRTITDYGTLTLTTVPEPATALLMGMGMGVAALALARRRAAAAPSRGSGPTVSA